MYASITPLLILAAGAVVGTGCAKSSAQSKPAGSPRSVELVVYADDFALVQESREVALQKGQSRIGIQDVSKQLDQDSVVYTWPETKDARVVSSTYELGTSDAGHLLQRFLGQEVELVYRGENGREGERQKGVLQVAEPGNIVVKVGDRLVVNPPATIETSANAGVVTISQLSAEIESSSEHKTRLDVNYLTRGLSWSADYTATLIPGDDTMGLECWATVTNTTGTEFPNATLSFVAGSPNRAARQSREKREQATMSETPAEGSVSKPYDAEAQMNDRFRSPVRAGELYAYPYKAAATILPDQMNRVRMMGSQAVKIERDYAIRLAGFDAYNYYARPEQRLNATLSLNFTNSKSTGLGLPLPAGALRVYEPGENGTVRYIGAASMGDTPTDARISATLTDVFDIYAQSKVLETKKVDKHTVARRVEVVLHNEKASDVAVRLVQDFWGKWKIANETSPSKKPNASSAQWTITVPKGGTKTLTYTVLLSY